MFYFQKKTFLDEYYLEINHLDTYWLKYYDSCIKTVVYYDYNQQTNIININQLLNLLTLLNNTYFNTKLF